MKTNHAEAMLKMSGRYKFIRRAAQFDADGNRVAGEIIEETPFGKNLITAVGLNYIMSKPSSTSEDMYLHCVVGSGNATPSISDTTLASYLGKYSAAHAFSVTRQYTTPPYSIKYRSTFRFWPGALGSGSVNIAEAGMIFSASSSASAINGSTQVCSRGLVVDGGGSPTTVSYDAANEYLDVVWEWTWWVPSSMTGTVSLTIDGTPTNHDYEVRPAKMDVGVGSSTSQEYGWTAGGFSQGSEPSTQGAINIDRPWPSLGVDSNGNESTWASPGALQSASQSISGTYTSTWRPNTFVFAAYTNGTYYRDMTVTWSLTNGNVGGSGISAVQILMNFSQWQISYSPAIAKVSTKQLVLTFRLSVANA